MNYIFEFFSNISTSEKKITWLGMFLISSCLFLQYILNADHINRDGIFYIFQAHEITEGSVALAREKYPNIILAQCIAWVHQLFHISYATAAHFIGFIFFMISSFFFLKTLTLISKDTRLLICGSLVILTSLAMDKYAVMILRDHALWAGLMMAIYFNIKFLNHPKWTSLVLSILPLTLAAMFRVESLSLIPIIFVFMCSKLYLDSHFKLLKYLVLTITVLTALGFVYFIAATDAASPFSRLLDVWVLLTQALLNMFRPLPITTTDYWLSELLKDHHVLFKFGFFFFLVIYKWISALGLIFLILFCIGFNTKKIKLSSLVRFFLLSMAAMTFIWPVLNLFSVYVLTSRYLVPHLWIVMIFITMGLYQVFFNWKKEKIKFKKFLQFFITMALLLKFISAMVDQHKPSMEQRIAQWVLENKITNEETFVNNLRIRYYMGWLTFPTLSLDAAIKDEGINYLILEHAMSDKDEPSFVKLEDLNEELKINSKLFIYQRK